MKKLSTLLVVIFSSILLFLIFYAYRVITENLTQEYVKAEAQTLSFLEKSFAAANISNIEKIRDRLEGIVASTPLEHLAFEFKRVAFSQETLLSMSTLLDESWSITDVSCDAYYGEIDSTEEGKYFLKASQRFQKFEPLELRFSAYKAGVVRDFRANLLFAFSLGQSVDAQKEQKIENERAVLSYHLKSDSLEKQIREIQELFIYGTLILYVSIFIFFYLYIIYVKKKEFENSLVDLDTYLETLLNNEFNAQTDKTDHTKEFQSIYNHIIELSKNFATVLNELNVTRDIIEKREITDELTGLPNKKWFEKDIKQMFVTNKMGYIIFFKIDQLGEFAKKHGAEIVNSLVEDFAKSVESYFATNRTIDGRCYRFFGAEFALIIYESDVERVKSVLKEIVELTKTLDDKYYFFDNQIYYGGTPFDKYGTVESILQSAKDEYSSVYAQKETFYSVLDQSEQIEKNKVLEASVKDIIERDDFALQYVFDTYDFSEPPNLIMQEISPMLIDMRTFERFPIGVFISVAEKMGIAMEFDKLLIKKALSHIEMAELEHLIAINLSVGAISSMRFLSWLSSTLTYEKHASSLVFVVTAYNAAANYELFTRFVETARSFEIKIMIKRYDINDLSLERLQEISPEYIRIERDYCNDLKRDNTKQHTIKQVLFVAEENNIKVLGDGVKSDADYTTIERLGFYGTSR